MRLVRGATTILSTAIFIIHAMTLFLPSGHSRAEDKPLPVPEAVRVEALRPNHSEAGRPLPLAAHWGVGEGGADGFTPEYQFQLLDQGRHVLPWFSHPPTDRWLQETWKPGAPEREKWIEAKMKEYELRIQKAAQLRLPLTFLGTQWESLLTTDKAYLDLPPEKNPNEAGLDGTIQPKVSPFGPVEPWREVGGKWTAGIFMKKLQEWYPDPPLVIFISNNEHSKLQWNEVETSKGYLERYGKGRDDDFKRRVVSEGWIERYRALQAAMREGLVNSAWKKNAMFVGYEVLGPPHMGRPMEPPEYWKLYSGYFPGRIDSGPLAWGGGSPSYYLHNWMPITDFTVWSPQIESMNWIFMLQEAHKLNPRFWFEMSTWDGDATDQPNAKRKFYARLGQSFTPERYGGFVQFGMWLLRPRVVREFRGWLETVEYAGPYFMSIVEAVDRVHTNAVLREFWRKGELVPNRAHQHPYQTDIPDEYKKEDRWFLLDTSLDAKWPWTLETEIPVYALALAKGKPPTREWLVYAHAPRRPRLNVEIIVPEFGPITVDVPQAGAFFHVSEQSKKMTVVWRGGPPSVAIGVASQFVESGKPVEFTALDPFAPNGKLTKLTWNFGDGKNGEGEKVTHAFSSTGQYLVELRASGDAKAEAAHAVPIFVGLQTEKDLVLRYIIKRPPSQGLLQWIWGAGRWYKPCYRFLYDSSGNNNLGFVAGSNWVDDPQRGAALELDGKESYVSVLNCPTINSGGPYANRTVLLWFRAADVTKRQMLYEEGGSGNGLNLFIHKGALRGGMWAKAVWPGTWLTYDQIEPNKWHHAALVLNQAGATVAADRLILYVDGKKAAAGAAAELPAHAGDIHFGRNGNTLYPEGAVEEIGDYFAGSFGQAEIYNRALAEAEIAARAKHIR
ncbi:MAG: PKD domain-containing protein [Verrucomicrobia bacterium]|nr:PKD domain-containing protein [Verrucomicrobiota bacterium]